MRAALFFWLTLVGATSLAQDAPNSEPETVLVQGERPGPTLWKISRGDHILWLLGTHSPLPILMTWRSAQVESAISESNEVLGVYAVSLKVSPQMQRIKRRPLKSVLSARSYANWRKLKSKYMGNAMPTEKLLPAEAAILLQSSAYRHAGLADSQEIWRTIYQLAHDYRVPVRRMDFEIELDPAKHISRNGQSGVAYLEQTMRRLDAGIKQSVGLANAWAEGDIEELKQLAEADASYASLLARSWPYLSKSESDDLARQAQNRLVSEFDRALRRNKTTFAGLPIYLLFENDGPLAAMRALGCSIQEPE
jgi:uncharacterized protein YbaP (TraB family)